MRGRSVLAPTIPRSILLVASERAVYEGRQSQRGSLAVERHFVAGAFDLRPSASGAASLRPAAMGSSKCTRREIAAFTLSGVACLANGVCTYRRCAVLRCGGAGQ